MDQTEAVASQERETCPALHVEANSLRKVLRIPAGGMKSTKNVTCWGWTGRGEEFVNKKRSPVACSFASGKASVTISSQPELCTVTLSKPHNMLWVRRFAPALLHSLGRVKANLEEVTFLRWKILISLRAMHEKNICYRNVHSKFTGKYLLQ